VRTTDYGQATGKLYHLRLRAECTLFCNVQSWARTHAVLVIGSSKSSFSKSQKDKRPKPYVAFWADSVVVYCLLCIVHLRCKYQEGAVVVVIVWWLDLYACSGSRCEFESLSDEVYSIQHYVIKFVSDLWQIDGFLRVLRFPPPLELTATLNVIILTLTPS